MRVVLDTNVIVSGLNFPGNERLVLGLALRGRYELCLSSFVLGEVAGVLMRKFGWAEERSSDAIRTLRAFATVVEPTIRLHMIERDHADNRILECAEVVGADYLVTGGRRHLLPMGKHLGARILNASRFLLELEGLILRMTGCRWWRRKGTLRRSKGRFETCPYG